MLGGIRDWVYLINFMEAYCHLFSHTGHNFSETQLSWEMEVNFFNLPSFLPSLFM